MNKGGLQRARVERAALARAAKAARRHEHQEGGEGAAAGPPEREGEAAAGSPEAEPWRQVKRARQHLDASLGQVAASQHRELRPQSPLDAATEEEGLTEGGWSGDEETEQEGSEDPPEREGGDEDASVFAARTQQPLEQPAPAAVAALPPLPPLPPPPPPRPPAASAAPAAPGPAAVGEAGIWHDAKASRAEAKAAKLAATDKAAGLAESREQLASYLSESPEWEAAEGGPVVGGRCSGLLLVGSPG